jgi:hypothetical protein
VRSARAVRRPHSSSTQITDPALRLSLSQLAQLRAARHSQLVAYGRELSSSSSSGGSGSAGGGRSLGPSDDGGGGGGGGEHTSGGGGAAARRGSTGGGRGAPPGGARSRSEGGAGAGRGHGQAPAPMDVDGSGAALAVAQAGGGSHKHRLDEEDGAAHAARGGGACQTEGSRRPGRHVAARGEGGGGPHGPLAAALGAAFGGDWYAGPLGCGQEAWGSPERGSASGHGMTSSAGGAPFSPPAVCYVTAGLGGSACGGVGGADSVARVSLAESGCLGRALEVAALRTLSAGEQPGGGGCPRAALQALMPAHRRPRYKPLTPEQQMLFADF